MGAYDCVEVGERVGQVKCFENTIVTYRLGDEVPWPGSFSIAMREGGFVNIQDGRVASWTDEPQHESIIDKYGGSFSPESSGIFGDDYLFDMSGGSDGC